MQHIRYVIIVQIHQINDKACISSFLHNLNLRFRNNQRHMTQDATLFDLDPSNHGLTTHLVNVAIILFVKT